MERKRLLDETVALLEGMIKIPSPSGKEAAVAAFLQEKLTAWLPASLERKGNNLVFAVEGEAPGPTLLLCSHIDTVEALATWTRDPYGAKRDGDKLYGLGANDAGASLVSMVAAMRRIGRPKKGRILLALVAEEEVGSQGFYTIEPSLPRYDAAIFGEPTDLRMAPSMRGAMKVLVRSRGVGCHASQPWEGKNAVDKMVEDIRLLRAIDLKDASPWGGATIEPTIVSGGKTSNQIPDLIETTLDIRTTADKNNDWILAELEKTGIEFEVLFNRRKPMANPANARLLRAFQACYPGVPECVFNGTCDMAFATAPSIVLGPGDLKMAHVADEYTELTQIEKAIDVYENVISTYLSSPEER